MAENRLTIEGRVTNYRSVHPAYSPLVIHNGRIYGFWLIGRWYASDRNFYGSYPPSYLSRIRSLVPDCVKVLHLFSGTIKGDGINEITYDINPNLEPNICDDADCLLKHFRDGEFDLILADPPYEERDFRKYGCKPFNKGKVVRDCSTIVRPSGFLVWLDTILPPFSTKDWMLFGIIGMVQSTNHRIRAVSIFQKQERRDK